MAHGAGIRGHRRDSSFAEEGGGLASLPRECDDSDVTRTRVSSMSRPRTVQPYSENLVSPVRVRVTVL